MDISDESIDVVEHERPVVDRLIDRYEGPRTVQFVRVESAAKRVWTSERFQSRVETVEIEQGWMAYMPSESIQ